jgi:F-type H+-transporting ATPase subunit b
LKRLTALDDDAKTQFRAAAGRSVRPLIVRSGFELSPSARERMARTLHEQVTPQSEVKFETNPALIAGIEVAFDGQKIAWTFEDYIRSLELSVGNLVEQETKANADGA